MKYRTEKLNYLEFVPVGTLIGFMMVFYLFSWRLIFFSADPGFVLGNGLLPYPVIFVFFTGLITGQLIAIIWNKPFAFCLPGHIDVSRRILIFMGLIAIISGSFFPMIFYKWTVASFFIMLFGMVGLNTMSYWMGVLASIRNERLFRIAIIIWLLLFFNFLIPAVFYKSTKDIEIFLVTYPWLFIFTGFPISIFIYRIVLSRESIRHICAKPWWSFANPQKKRSSRKTSGRTGSIHNYFFKQIESNSHSSLLQHILGQIYITFSFNKSFWLLLIFYVPLFGLYHCFIGIGNLESSSSNLIFFSILLGEVCLIPESDILLPYGRRERFLRDITTVVVVVLKMVVFFLILALLLKIISHIAHIDLSPAPYSYSLTPIIITPLAGSVAILFSKRIKRGCLTNIIVFILAILGAIFFNYLIFTAGYGGLVAVLSWASALAVLYYKNMKPSLLPVQGD